MSTIDLRIDALARVQDNVISRRQVLDAGGTDDHIANRLARGLWQPLQAGVYLVGSAPPTWAQSLRAGLLASGPGAEVARRAAHRLWGLDGLASVPLELNVPYGGLPVPEGVLVHRTRRCEPPRYLFGLATTSIERTLLELGASCPPIVIEQAAASAFRMGRSTPAKVTRYLELHAGRGRPGVTKLREAMRLYEDGGRPPGSSGEVTFLRELRRAGIEPPVRQVTIDLPGGNKATVDFAWPLRRKALEFVGWWTHSDPRRHDDDTWREDDIRAVGWDLRRVAPWSLTHRPEALAASVLRFLCRDFRVLDANPDTER